MKTIYFQYKHIFFLAHTHQIFRSDINLTIYFITLPTLKKFDVHPEPEVNFTFKSISHNSGNSSMHEEISGATDHGNVPRLVQNGIGSGETYSATAIICGVESKSEAKPSSEGVLGVIYVKPLCSANRFGVKIVVQGNRIVENRYVSEMKLACQDGVVGSFGGCNYCRSCISRVFAIVNDVMEEKHKLFAWFVLFLFHRVG